MVKEENFYQQPHREYSSPPSDARNGRQLSTYVVGDALLLQLTSQLEEADPGAVELPTIHA